MYLVEKKSQGGSVNFQSADQDIKCRLKFTCVDYLMVIFYLFLIVIGQFKCKIVASVFKFLLALQLLLARPASIQWILLANPQFPIAFGELASGRFPQLLFM
jgi:hypothetical protein